MGRFLPPNNTVVLIPHTRHVNYGAVCCGRGRENLSRMSGGCRASMVRVGRRQRGTAGEPCQGPWALVEPRHKAVDIHRGGDGDVLPVGLRQPPISGPSEAKGTDPLGERPFDAGPSLIELLPLRAGRPGLCRGQRLVLVLGWQPQPPAGVLGPGTAGPYGTRPTDLFVEGPND